MKISIVIVTYNSENHIFDCLESIFLFNDIGNQLEIIIVDNSVKDSEPLFNAIKNCYPNNRIKLIKNEKNGGYGQGNNVGISQAEGDVILIMNPDVRLMMPIFNDAIAVFESKNAVMFGMTQMVSETTKGLSFYTINPSIPIINVLEVVIRNRFGLYSQKTMCISGACFFLDKKSFEEINLFDENIFMYGEENDIHYRFRKLLPKKKIIFNPNLKYLHLVDGRFPDIQTKKKMLQATIYFCKKNSLNVSQLIQNEIIGVKFWIVIEKLKGKKDYSTFYSKWLIELKKLQ